MLVRMLKDCKGRDTDSVEDYRKDEQYNIGDSLVRAFMDMGTIEIVETEEKPKTPVIENKAIEPVTEDKQEGALREKSKEKFDSLAEKAKAGDQEAGRKLGSAAKTFLQQSKKTFGRKKGKRND